MRVDVKKHCDVDGSCQAMNSAVGWMRVCTLIELVRV
jgi:hypothetical protein